jgi:LmbE family N-acetylglucosaminyl deacetylase
MSKRSPSASTTSWRQSVLDLKTVERVLVITAHPDDLDFGTSGTIATLTGMGIHVSYCICTNGDAGGFDPAVPRSEIPLIRQREQRAAGQQLGVTADDIHFLGYADGSLEVTMDLRRDISRVIRQVRPQIAIVQSPQRSFERMYASHPDHLAAGEAALCAIYPDARNPFTHTVLLAEGHEAWSVPETWIMTNEDANHYVDITDQFDKKVAALLAHVSQTEHMGEAGIRERVGEWNAQLAQQAGFPDGRFAEAFRVMDTQ